MIPIPACTRVTAPDDGRVERSVPVRTRVAAGEVVGALRTARGERPLVAAHPGTVAGELAGAGQAVAAGEPVLWLHR